MILFIVYIEIDFRAVLVLRNGFKLSSIATSFVSIIKILDLWRISVASIMTVLTILICHVLVIERFTRVQTIIEELITEIARSAINIGLVIVDWIVVNVTCHITVCIAAIATLSTIAVIIIERRATTEG